MTAPWMIRPTIPRVRADRQRHAEITFTVTNPGPVDVRAVFDVVPGENAERSWFTVDEPQRLIPHGSSVPFTVRIAVPPAAPPAAYSLAGRVYSAESAPEESSVVSDRVTIDVAAPAVAGRPWWWWLIPAAVVVLAVAGALAWLLTRDSGPPNGTPTATPTRGPVNIDLLDLAPSAAFRSGAGALPFGGSEVDPRGFVLMRDGQLYPLEAGTASRYLEMHPQWVSDGYIEGDFALAEPILAGDRFRATVGFMAGSFAGDASFVVLAVFDDGQVAELAREWDRAADGLLPDLDVDLRPAAGARTIRLRVEAGPNSSQDWAAWIKPRVQG